MILVAREGVKPPTPAFSELGYEVFSTTWNARTTLQVIEKHPKLAVLWTFQWAGKMPIKNLPNDECRRSEMRNCEVPRFCALFTGRRTISGTGDRFSLAPVIAIVDSRVVACRRTPIMDYARKNVVTYSVQETMGKPLAALRADSMGENPLLSTLENTSPASLTSILQIYDAFSSLENRDRRDLVARSCLASSTLTDFVLRGFAISALTLRRVSSCERIRRFDFVIWRFCANHQQFTVPKCTSLIRPGGSSSKSSAFFGNHCFAGRDLTSKRETDPKFGVIVDRSTHATAELETALCLLAASTAGIRSCSRRDLTTYPRTPG